jgi:hypothetical protein
LRTFSAFLASFSLCLIRLFNSLRSIDQKVDMERGDRDDPRDTYDFETYSPVTSSKSPFCLLSSAIVDNL